MTSNDDLEPCPFCGGCAWIDSNRDWHRLKADHSENCFIGEHEPMYPATDEQRRYLVLDWNQRSKQEAQ